MKRGWIINGGLLLGVAALAAYAWHQSTQPKEVTFKLSTQIPTAVKKIEVVPAGGTGYAVEKRGDLWFLTSPMQARADATQAQRLLDLLSASSKEKLPATDLKPFELDHPAVAVKIDGQNFAFGTTNPLTQEQYVATGDGVYLVSAYYASLIPTRADRMIAHTLFSPAEKPVGFTFTSFRVEQKDGKWLVQPPTAAGKEQSSQDDLNRWADDWRLSASLLTQTWTPTATPETIKVALADGKTLALNVIQKAPDLIVGRADERLQFRFSAEMSKRLLEPDLKDQPRAGTP